MVYLNHGYIIRKKKVKKEDPSLIPISLHYKL